MARGDFRPEDYLSKRALENAQKTKWWLLARFIDRILYDGDVRDVSLVPESSLTAKQFTTSEKIYIGDDFSEHIKCFGREGAYVETRKGLRELMHECERMAIKEST